MFPKFEVCNTTRSTITEVPFSSTVRVLKEIMNNLVISFNKSGVETLLVLTL